MTHVGLKMILAGAAVAGFGAFIAMFCKISGISIAVIGLLFTLFSAYFFRDPERPRVFSPEEIACPGDGRVLKVGVESDPDITVVRIFLSVFNVHIQRAPIEGEVESVNYTKGTFSVASSPDADKNERNRIKITGTAGKSVEVEQITGAIARRIACWVKPGQKVKSGERIGMIYFGSQVAVYLPSSAIILVKPGDKVRGAETVLGKW